MKVTVRQRILAFGKQYRALDEGDVQRYEISSMLYSPERRKEVLDGSGRILAWSEWPVMSGRAELHAGGMDGTMEIPFLTLSPEWELMLEGGGRYLVQGDMFRMSFAISGDKGVAATIDKRIIAFSDTYEVETLDASFPMEFALLIAALIDHKYHSDRN